MKQKTNIMSARISAPCTPGEKDTLLQNAKLHNMTPAEYTRFLIRNDTHSMPLSQEQQKLKATLLTLYFKQNQDLETVSRLLKDVYMAMQAIERNYFDSYSEDDALPKVFNILVSQVRHLVSDYQDQAAERQRTYFQYYSAHFQDLDILEDLKEKMK